MLTGTQISNILLGKSLSQREEIVTDLIVKDSNFPSWVSSKRFIKVSETGTDSEGTNVVISFFTSQDYLSVGTDYDFIRIPLKPTTAQKILTHLNCMFPTKHMVDTIYKNSHVRLEPKPISPKPGAPGREDFRTFLRSNKLIEDQLNGCFLAPGSIIAGHKKDLVVTNQLLSNPGKVAIYGWHTGNGLPIQPLFLGHGDFYVDYSHGIRLISTTCEVDGKPEDLMTVLSSSKYGSILTGEKPLKVEACKYK